LPLGVKATSIATHDLKFDARERATEAITKTANYTLHIYALAL
jgi:hypothetical protein